MTDKPPIDYRSVVRSGSVKGTDWLADIDHPLVTNDESAEQEDEELADPQP
jgi:hypothetical protein